MTRFDIGISTKRTLFLLLLTFVPCDIVAADNPSTESLIEGAIVRSEAITSGILEYHYKTQFPQ